MWEALAVIITAIYFPSYNTNPAATVMMMTMKATTATTTMAKSATTTQTAAEDVDLKCTKNNLTQEKI